MADAASKSTGLFLFSYFSLIFLFYFFSFVGTALWEASVALSEEQLLFCRDCSVGGVSGAVRVHELRPALQFLERCHFCGKKRKKKKEKRKTQKATHELRPALQFLKRCHF